MKVIEYFSCDRPEHWLRQIKKSDWGAGQYLYELLSENKFKSIVGETSKVLLLTNGDELVSFCTYAEIDDIQPTDLTPWMGFVYTFPEYRGHRYVGELFLEIERLARAEKVHDVYISTNHIGLYEKYGCEFYQMMNDMEGETSRVYRKHIERCFLGTGERFEDGTGRQGEIFQQDQGGNRNYVPHHGRYEK